MLPRKETSQAQVPVQRDLKVGSQSASGTLFNGMVLYHRDLPHEVIESMCVFSQDFVF